MTAFEEEFLAKIADALGVPAELLGKDYDACMSPEERAARNWWQKYDQLMRYRDAEMQAIWFNAFLYAAIWTVESYCGYDPQKLLPDHRSMLQRWNDADATPLEDLIDLFYPNNFDIDREYIDFDRPISPTARYIGGTISFPALYKPLALDGEVTYTVQAEWPHKMAVIDIDYVEIEQLLAREGIRSVFINVGSPGGVRAGKTDLFALHQPKKVAKKPPPS